MKNLLTSTLLAGLLLGTNTLNAQSQLPGFVDFGKITELGGESTVDIHLKGPLLSMAARIIDKSETEAAELLRNLKLVRVNVFKLDDKNRAEIQKRIKGIRANLETEKWEPIVSVHDKNDDVGVYVKMRGEEAIEGIVVTVIEGKGEAVFINIVGDIKPEQLGMVADKLNLDPLKKVKIKKSRAQGDKARAPG
jgi:hypothetical protein